MSKELNRTTFSTSRMMDFFSEKELITQTGHSPQDWPLVTVKELVDNSLDACEETGISPELHVKVSDDGIEVSDNGPGIPAETVARMLDFNIRVSSREAYVAPDRGAQGNALKTIIAMPFVLSEDKQGRVEIDACGVRHDIRVAVNNITQTPEIERKTEVSVKKGTSVKVFWPDSAGSLIIFRIDELLPFIKSFSLLNPHLTLTVDWFGEHIHVDATTDHWPKWIATNPTAPHWYEPEHLSRLIAGYIANGRSTGRGRTVRDFLSEFRGLSSTQKRKKVLEETGFGQMSLEALANPDGIDVPKVQALLASMKKHSDPVKPQALGVIGQTHIKKRFEELNCEMDSFEYRKVAKYDDSGLPYVLEVAFACLDDPESERRLITGVNWSVGIVNPFRKLRHESLDSILMEQRAGEYEPIAVLVHLAYPRPEYTDRGKSAIVVDHIIAGEIEKQVELVTRKWAKQRKAEERRSSARLRRKDAMQRSKSNKITVKMAVWILMVAAYLKASDNCKLPANARQIYYAIRAFVLEMTGEETLDSKYFTQTLLPDFIAEHPEETKNWDVVYDSRGHYTEPHTGEEIGLGTLNVRQYLKSIASHTKDGCMVPKIGGKLYPTKGPRNRCSALLFIEKEGFASLFEAVKLAERYDLAIMSTKGMSVVAARQLIDELCHVEAQVPLLVLHDFDKAGFSILGTLTNDTRRYAFQNSIHVIDLGIRIGDVIEYGLESEPCRLSSKDLKKLREHGATQEEVDFLSERRVELNAFSSGDFIEWIESKLQQHGVKKVVPDESILQDAYQRAVFAKRLDKLLAESSDSIWDEVTQLKPTQLSQGVSRLLEKHPDMPWDRAVNMIVVEESEVV